MERVSSLIEPSDALLDVPFRILLLAGWRLQADWKLILEASAQHRVHPRLGLIGYLVNAYMGGLAIDFSTALYLYQYHAGQSPEWHAAMFSILTSRKVRHAYAKIENSEPSDWHHSFNSFSWLDQERRAEDVYPIYSPLFPWARDIASQMGFPSPRSHSSMGFNNAESLRRRTISLLSNILPSTKHQESQHFIKIKTGLGSHCGLRILSEDISPHAGAYPDPSQALFNELVTTAVNVIKSTSYKARLPPTVIHQATSYIEIDEFKKLDGLGFWMLPRFISEITKRNAKHINLNIVLIFVKVLTSPKILATLLNSLGYFDEEMASQSPAPESYFRVLAAMSYILFQDKNTNEFSVWMVDTILPLVWHLEEHYEAYRLAEQLGCPWSPKQERSYTSITASDSNATLNNSSDQHLACGAKFDNEKRVIANISPCQGHFQFLTCLTAFLLGGVLAVVYIGALKSPGISAI